MMQGVHQQQQQVAALLSAALNNNNNNNNTNKDSSADESNRLGAINSLHRFILYPPNSVAVAHSATFLSQGLFQLLSHNSYPVRRSGATTHGALCAVLCSVMLGSNGGRHNHALLTTVVDRFINWALPLLRNNNASIELALEAIHEFLSVGDAGAIERYSFPTLKACQELLEDERTSLTVLHLLLGDLTVISLKFFRIFQPHFVDIVDLLLGWVMVPDLAESDTRAIIGSFMQFQNHWVANLQFPMGLLLKFLGDMDVLLQDGNPGTPQKFRRLLALLSCFSTVLQSTASGMLEMNLLLEIIEPLNKMIPKLLGCLSMIGKKFGWSKWNEDLWRCLTLLAEILGEKFSTFYPLVIDILFHILDMDYDGVLGGGNITSSQIHGVVKTNLQLLSLQKLGLLSSSVRTILQFDGPISLLRMHPNHLVTASTAATYIFLLQHGNNEVVDCAINCLFEELILLNDMLKEHKNHENAQKSDVNGKLCSRLELLALFKFDLKVLPSPALFSQSGSLIGHPDTVRLSLNRSDKVVSFIVANLNPTNADLCMEQQICIFEALTRLTSAEFLKKCSFKEHTDKKDSLPKDNSECIDGICENQRFLIVTLEHLKKYSPLIIVGLESHHPLAVKLKALDWVHQFAEDFMITYENSNGSMNPCELIGNSKIICTLVLSVLAAALDGEPKVRSEAAIVSELLLQSKLVYPAHMYQIGGFILEKLGDPDAKIRSAFVRLLADILPVTIYLHGQSSEDSFVPNICNLSSISNLHWKQIFALMQLPQHLHAQQLVSVLGFISQRWKMPLSSWIERFIYSCQSVMEPTHAKKEETELSGDNTLWVDLKPEKDLLGRIASVNHLAGVWWAIHEAARYCTATRLRTNLGGPTQSFAALERMLLDVAHVLQIDAEQSDGSLSIIGSSGAHLLPMRLLLDFVEALKKNVYNAYDGSTVIQCASRQSSLFFRANKKVCEEWFSRICEPMMNAALALQYHDATIHYCSLRLQDLRCSLASALTENSVHSSSSRLLGDFIRVVRHMALALCKKREPEMLIGLHKWVYNTSLFAEEKQIPGSKEISGALLWIHGLAYEANGQYEKSAPFFAHLLQEEESLSSMGAGGVQFAISRIIRGYTATSDWKSLESWLSELQSLRAKHAGKSYAGALTVAGNEMNAIHALARFDEDNLPAAWASLDLTPKNSSELTLDPKLALQRSEQLLLQAMLFRHDRELEKLQYATQRAKLMLDEVLTVLPLDGMQEAAPYAMQLHCIYTLEEFSRLNKAESTKKLNSSTNYLSQALRHSFNKFHQDCDSWLKLFRVYRTILPNSSTTLQLCKNIMTLARKQGNLELAYRLSSYLKLHVNNCSETTCGSFLTLSLKYEEILMMHAEKKFVNAVMELWSFMRPCLLSSQGPESGALDNYVKAKSCLKLSTWLRQGCSDINMEIIVPRIFKDCNLVDGEDASHVDEILASGSSMNQMLEKIAGAAVKASTRLCPAMCKSWISYASWCFGQAKYALSSSHSNASSFSSFSKLGPEMLPQKFTLSKEETSQVECIISTLLQEICSANNSNVEDQHLWKVSFEDQGDVNIVNSLLQQVVAVLEATAGAPGADSFVGQSLSAHVVDQLQITLLSKLNVEETIILSSLDGLVNVWRALRHRRVSMFGHAANGYIQFLCHSSSKLSDNPVTASDFGTVSQTYASLTLRATLFILHILLNYGVELKDVLGPALSAVPLFPWQELTPQLFARLSSHSEPIIRKQLEGLLIMLAKLAPRSVVYPALVDVNTSDEEPQEELQHILDCLTKLYPGLVQDVRLMMHELGNVTVLWEELWLSTLQDLHGDVMRRLNLLKEEAARIENNVTLSHNEKCKISAAKYSAMMAPVFVVLERRLALTSRKPETPHESWFQKEYQEKLKSYIAAFKSPPVSSAALGDVWRPFDNIAASLAAYQRKSSVSLQEVAPRLACLSSSDVPMPGLEKQVVLSESDRGFTTASQGITTIASFSEQVAILPTKTKPKKIVLLGSDGEKYTYLLKGREDLRLDARIMQLLEAVNNILHSSSETKGHSLGIRYYSVTPISGCAGLIQWVDNVISIYSVFKSWQQRIHLTQLFAAAAGNTKSDAPPSVPRPSDLFYGKIIPALKEKGIRKVISRRDWPHEVKKKVLLELMQETPRQLLHQELWCASQDFKAFSSKRKRYSGSLAAMSVVGHIIGLGDRHLDNILMDFVRGEIVHIDYNVCFDKGQRLKVPEIVPFRLTQTLEAALGLTGVEGRFRSDCESVLGVLRKNKDMLLMLLEVFVWDPLVEWTRGDFHDDAALGGEERKGMELAVSLSLFASRVQEIRIPLQEHHDLLLEAIPSVESALKRFMDALNQYEEMSALIYRMDQERSALLIHETSVKSLVAEATSSLDKVCAVYEMQVQEFGQAKALGIEKTQAAIDWIEQHGRVIDALRSGSLQEIENCKKLSDMQNASTLISAVSAAGIPLTIVPEPTQAQCYDIDREVSEIIAELDHGVSCAVTSLQAYSLALQRFLPLNYLTTSPMHGWTQVLQLCTNTISSDTLSRARRQASELIARGHRDALDPASLSLDDLCGKVETCALQIRKLEEECAELVSSIGGEAETKAKDCLLSAFKNHMQSTGFARKEEPTSSFKFVQVNSDGAMDANIPGELNIKKQALSILYAAVFSLYDITKCKLVDLLNDITDGESANFGRRSDFGGMLHKLEEYIEKCVLLEEIVDEVRQQIDSELISSDKVHNLQLTCRSWASNFKESLVACKDLVAQMTDVFVPDLMRYVMSSSSEVMDAFGALSQIRGSVETALEQLVHVELEKESLEELEKSYFVKVGHITEQQLALEEAAMKERDQLSWEEAEELASQQDSCKAQLDQLQQTWNEKDMQASSLIKKEASMKGSLGSSERHFLSLINDQDEKMLHFLRSKAVLSMLAQPFAKLESLDKGLSTYLGKTVFSLSDISNLVNCLNSGRQISEYIWTFKGLLDSYTFFVWKVGVMASVLDIVIQDVSSSMDQNVGFEQLTRAVKKKLATHLHGIMTSYLRGQIAPALLNWLERASDSYQQASRRIKELGIEQSRKDNPAVKKVQNMLEEYCNAHETVRAATSTSSLMRKQISDLKEVIQRTSLDIVRTEWMYDVTSATSHRCKYISQKYFETDDSLYPLLINLSRPKLLEALQSAVSLIARSRESLQSCERNSAAAEGQLERAMNWACGGCAPGTSGNTYSRGDGIPPEFHYHLKHRRQFLEEAEEKAKDVMQVCSTVLEFEASRDGFLGNYAEISQYRSDANCRTWQQNYLNVLVRLDISFHSSSRAEQDWMIAQSSLKAASNSFFAAGDELRAASNKTNSASGDMQSTLLKMRDCACETSNALSAFSRVVKDHTALTSECGSMLEEVLSLTGLHEIHNLGKEAASTHHSLMKDLSTASALLLPLESVLSKDVSSITDAMARERETKSEISPIHGQAICQSYTLRIRESCLGYEPLVPLIISSVKELYSLLIKLAQTASLDAGNMHKALEGLGECEEARSDEINLSREDITDQAPHYENVVGTIFPTLDAEQQYENPLGANELSTQERGWVSPPDSIYSSSSESGEGNSSSSFNCLEVMDQLSLYSVNKGDGNNIIQLSETQEGTTHLQEPDGCGVEIGSISGSLLEPGIEISNDKNSDVMLPERDEELSSRTGVNDENQKYQQLAKDARVIRGKNAFAVAVLRRIEMKIDGQDIDESRQISISEQIDYLLKEATSMDNLCNMYEGWTPWI